jgi:hypothetical protein
MRRIWLAALLGVILGLGVSFASTVPAPNLSPRENLVFNTGEPQLKTEKVVQATLPDVEFVLLAFLVGLVVGAPFFVMARNRSR